MDTVINRTDKTLRASKIEDQTNGTETNGTGTTELNDTTRQRVRRDAFAPVEPANDQWLTWIMNLEGGWGMWLAQTVLPIIVIVVLILLCIPCIIQCVSSLVQRLVKVGMSVQLVKMTVYPDDDVNVDDQQYDDASSGSYSERGN